jgi:hypothetical protein
MIAADFSGERISTAPVARIDCHSLTVLSSNFCLSSPDKEEMAI